MADFQNEPMKLSNFAQNKLRRYEREIDNGDRQKPKFVRKDFIFYCFGECDKVVKGGQKALKFAHRFEFCESCGKQYQSEKTEKKN